MCSPQLPGGMPFAVACVLCRICWVCVFSPFWGGWEVGLGVGVGCGRRGVSDFGGVMKAI